jgi:putative ribosome biogenesis GTPase RsgA
VYKNKKISEVIETKEYIDSGFEDIIALSKSCKFPNCTHTTETGCTVIEGISNGRLSEERFNSYFKEKNEAEYVTNQKNKTKAIDYMKQNKYFTRS